MFCKVNILLFSSLLNIITESVGRWIGESVGKWSVVRGSVVRGFKKTLTGLRPTHGNKYTIHKMSLGLMMAMCIEQHLSNI